MLVWRGGGAGDLHVDVTLGAQGAGVFSLMRLDPATGIYAPIGQRSDNPPDIGHPIFTIPAAQIAALNGGVLSLRLNIVADNPAATPMPVTLRVGQAAGDLNAEDGAGDALPPPVGLNPDLQPNQPEVYDFDVWFP